MAETVESTAASPADKIESGGWQAFLSTPDGYVTADEYEIAEMFEDARGEISIRRGSALPDEEGKLPGSYQGEDIFIEVDLDSYEPDYLPQVWELAQKAAWGMNQELPAAAVVAPVTEESAKEN